MVTHPPSDTLLNLFRIDLNADAFCTHFSVLRYPVPQTQEKGFAYSRMRGFHDLLLHEKYLSLSPKRKWLYLLTDRSQASDLQKFGFVPFQNLQELLARNDAANWGGGANLIQMLLSSRFARLGLDEHIRGYDGEYPLIPAEKRDVPTRAAVRWNVTEVSSGCFSLLPSLKAYRSHPLARRHEGISVATNDLMGLVHQDAIYIYRKNDQGAYVELPAHSRSINDFRSGDLVLGPSVRKGKEDLNWMEFKAERKPLTRTYLIHKCIRDLTSGVLSDIVKVESVTPLHLDRRTLSPMGRLSHKKEAFREMQTSLKASLKDTSIVFYDGRLHGKDDASNLFQSLKQVSQNLGVSLTNAGSLIGSQAITSEEEVVQAFSDVLAIAPKNCAWFFLVDDFPGKGYFDTRPTFYRLLGPHVPRQSLAKVALLRKTLKENSKPDGDVAAEIQVAFVNLAIKVEIVQGVIAPRAWLQDALPYRFVLQGQQRKKGGAVRYFSLVFDGDRIISFHHCDGNAAELDLDDGLTPLIIDERVAPQFRRSSPVIIKPTTLRVLPPMGQGARGWAQLSGILEFPEHNGYAVGPIEKPKQFGKGIVVRSVLTESGEDNVMHLHRIMRMCSDASVRYKQLTVQPAPFKFLSEYMDLHGYDVA